MFLRRLFESFFGNNPHPKTNKSTNKPPNTTTGEHKPVFDPVFGLSNAASHIVIPPSPVKKVPKKKTGQHKRDRIPKQVRDAVWTTYHGSNVEGPCYACGKIVQRYHAGWHCSHVISVNKGGNLDVENLRTCCQHCNLSMGNQNLYAYIRDKNMTGPGSKNVYKYFHAHKSQINDKRTNNWK